MKIFPQQIKSTPPTVFKAGICADVGTKLKEKEKDIIDKIQGKKKKQPYRDSSDPKYHATFSTTGGNIWHLFTTF